MLAVRERPDLGPGMYEAIDGNHRTEAVFEYLKWPVVRCENFGEIPLAEAVLIARRRNYQWFEDDLSLVSKLYKEVVLPEFGSEDLATFMPETQQQIEEIAKLTDFDWESLPGNEGKGAGGGAEGEGGGAGDPTLSFPLTGELSDEWMQWLAVARGHSKADSPEQALLYALRCAFAFVDTVQTGESALEAAPEVAEEVAGGS